VDEELAARWERLLAVREEILRALEDARKEKRIGSAQEAAVILETGGEPAEFLAAHRVDLETICIVSALAVKRRDGAGSDLTVAVERAAGQKCPRCWNYREHAGSLPGHPAVCDRCAAVLAEAWPTAGRP